MRLLLTFIIFILGGFYTFGNDNCCKQCCEYLENCCNKGGSSKREEVLDNKTEEEKEKKKVGNNGEGEDENSKEEGEGEEENNKKEEEEEDKNEVQEEAKDLVNENWLNRKKNTVLKIFNKDENENENEYKSGDIKIELVKKDGKTKIIILGNMKENLKKKTQKWALFKIKKKKGTGNKEEETIFL